MNSKEPRTSKTTRAARHTVHRKAKVKAFQKKPARKPESGRQNAEREPGTSAPPIPEARRKRPPGGAKPARAAEEPSPLPAKQEQSKSKNKEQEVLADGHQEQGPGGRPPGAIASPSAIEFPAILLEGDEGGVSIATGPGQKFAAGPTPAFAALRPEKGELPEAYGTGRLFAIARDPHCLYAHWDLSAKVQHRYNSSSMHGHLVLRVYIEQAIGKPATELHVHPESKHWFVHVEQAGKSYVTELGYYEAGQQWRRIALSDPVAAPSDVLPQEGPVQFATMENETQKRDGRGGIGEQEVLADGHQEQGPGGRPPRARAEEPPAPVVVRADLPPQVSAQGPRLRLGLRIGKGVQPAIQAWPEAAAGPPPLQAAGLGPVPGLRLLPTPPPPPLTPEERRVVEEGMGLAPVKTEWFGSEKIEELIGPHRGDEIFPAEVSQRGRPAPTQPTAIFSPMGGEAAVTSPAGGEMFRPAGFWFNVNAELVVYGATEPNARVTIGGRPIRLRPDGTFSFRFALPDGVYSLPISAQAAHGEVREAQLVFSRSTHYAGEVGVHAQDPSLKVPDPQNVS